MARGRWLAVAVLAVGLAALLTADTAAQRVEVDDPAGDVQSSDEHPGKDMVKTVLSSDGTQLLIDVTLAKDARFYLDGHQAGDVVRLEIDTDRDLATGGKVLFGRKPGFDVEVKVRACITYESGEACAGGLGGTPAKAFFSSIDVGRYAQGEPFSKSTHEPFWKSERWPIEGRQVHVAVPYADLGVQSGQTVRLAVVEADGGFSDKAYSPDVMLELK